jgi:hypothetical protein
MMTAALDRKVVAVVTRAVTAFSRNSSGTNTEGKQYERDVRTTSTFQLIDSLQDGMLKNLVMIDGAALPFLP